MVCALTGANGIFTLKQNLEEKCVNAILSKNNYPEEKLDYFEELYKKTKQDRYMQHYVLSQTFKPDENIDESITRFNKYRNKFIHFTPQIFILNPSGLPQLFIELIKYLEFIGNESENILWYRNEGKVFAKGLQTLKQKCKYLEGKYNGKTK
jgi:hypothetical protein